MAPYDLFTHLTSQARTFGYASLNQEERQFLLRYRKDHGITQKKTPKKQVRKWTDVYYCRRKKNEQEQAKATRKKATRKPRNGRVFVDRTVATWNPRGIDTSFKAQDSFSEDYLKLLHS